MQIKSLVFEKYKLFPEFTVSARTRNVLVGPNNIGKSTALDAFRIVFDTLRFATRRMAVLKSQGADGVCSTYFVPQTVVQTDLRYCVHNFEDGYARISVAIENGNKFNLKIPRDGEIECYLKSDVPARKNAQHLRNQFPLAITIVPTLSPLEQNEELVRSETVEKNRYGRLASRNFRNFWLHRTESEFETFADLVELGWPGIRIKQPEIEKGGSKPIVRMYFRDGRHVREVQWAGFGFQVWMQTMMHLLNTDHKSVLVLDEPDIYLHPDLQHRLLKVVSQRVGQYFIATHSTEIINAVDPGDVLILRANSKTAKRIRTEGDYSEVFEAIGSSENAQFARLARTRKVVYFEGLDNRLLSKLARVLGGIDYLADSSVTLMKTDGFANWSRVSTTSWILKKFFDFEVQVAVLFDRDYRCDQEVEEFTAKMAKGDVNCHVLPVKEIENLLLVPGAIKSVISKYKSKPLEEDWEKKVDDIFSNAIESVRSQVLGSRIGKKIEFEVSKKPMSDIPTISNNETKTFEADWANEDFRRRVVPGKAVFATISKAAQDEFGVTLTGSRVVDELDVPDIHPDVFKILVNLRDFFAE